MQELVRKTLGQLLEENAKYNGETEALVHPMRNTRMTYAEFNEECETVAKGFMAMGVKKGDHIAVWATNYPQWITTMFAAAKIGAVMVTVNTNYKVFELEYLLKQSDTMTLILIDGYKDVDYISCIQQLCPELADSEPGKLNSARLPYLKNVIHLPASDYQIPPDGMFEWEDLYALAKQIDDETYAAARRACDPDDVVMMQYTSGTTGFPKGVMLTHYNIVNNGCAIGECMKLTNHDRLLIHVPLFHCFGCVLGVMACVNFGTTMVLMDYFHPVRSMQTLQNERCTAVHGVPTMFIAMLEHESFSKFHFFLRTGIMAGSPCPVEIMRRVVNDMGMSQITITYGLTESSPAITMTRTNDPLEVRVATVGRPMPHLEAKIVDMDTGEDLPQGQIGEIVTRGYQVMKGYYKMPEATAEAIDKDGWLHSGDLGMVDENGYFKVTGRLKDMIIRGGENIYPRELEEFLYTHEAVQDVQVIGVPDVRYGEEVAAYVILKPGYSVTEQDLLVYVRQGLSRFKAPRYVRFVKEFPMTASGKIQKYKMREMAIEELGLQDAAKIETA